MDTNGDLTLFLDFAERGISYSTGFKFKARSGDFSLDDEA
jgi:hypothetical protein